MPLQTDSEPFFAVETERQQVRSLWVAALRDAAGILSAYVTPAGYGLGIQSVVGKGADPHDAFLREIRGRVDLGRASVFTQLAEELSHALTSAYRHEVFYTQRNMRGKIHLPRYVASLAQGGGRGIPVIRARRQRVTPENLLVAEGIQASLAVTEIWASLGGAEGARARDLAGRLQRLDARQPWAGLRSQPRPALENLISIVQGRSVAGIISAENPAVEVAALLGSAAGDATAFEASAPGLYMLLSRDPAFANKIFELLCLAWLIAAFEEVVDESKTWPGRIQAARGKPIYEGRTGATRYRIYFQSGRTLGRRWSVRRSASDPRDRRLGGVPDFVLESNDQAQRRLVLLDAKNRAWGARSEVAYKLLGYKENLRLRPYMAAGIFPTSKGRLRVLRLVRGKHRVFLLRVPLASGRNTFRRLARRMIHSDAA